MTKRSEFKRWSKPGGCWWCAAGPSPSEKKAHRRAVRKRMLAAVRREILNDMQHQEQK